MSALLLVLAALWGLPPVAEALLAAAARGEESSGLPHDDFLHEKCILALEMWKDYRGGTFSLSTSVPHESLQIYSRMSTLDLLLEPVLKQLFFQQYLVKYNEGRLLEALASGNECISEEFMDDPDLIFIEMNGNPLWDSSLLTSLKSASMTPAQSFDRIERCVEIMDVMIVDELWLSLLWVSADGALMDLGSTASPGISSLAGHSPVLGTLVLAS
ncbi:hypothetical protein HGM15179_004909 [Zosterops borbonicus]|uniref:Uncharacterized protein n=1 Tax=Zosterops borbonicus TaxID=364589 RepID=A0A8K1LQM5_9PASS|nr:hypothetical protein HGM15179_004909 [Zosterops borbonicus]